MDSRQQLTTMYASRRHRREEQEELERKKRAAEQGNVKFEAKRESMFASAFAAIIIIMFLGIILAIPTMTVSFMLALFSIPLIILYYIIKGFNNKNKAKNQLYTCLYCKKQFKGATNKCPYCGNNINCDTNRYECTYCNSKFTGKHARCPKCNIPLYYK